MWGTDMTQTITIGDDRAYVFVAVEHANLEVVVSHGLWIRKGSHPTRRHRAARMNGSGNVVGNSAAQ